MKIKHAIIGLLATLSISSTPTLAAQVYLAGMSFAGDATTLDYRLRYTRRYEAAQTQAKVRLANKIYQNIQSDKPENFTLAPLANQAELKGQDQTIMVSMVITNETISQEQFGPLTKFFIQIRAQALFFDMKSQTILRAYPFSFAYLDLLDHTASEAEIDDRIRQIFDGSDKKAGLFSRFTNILKTANLPNGVSKFLQVSNVNIAPEALAGIHPSLTANKGAAETWVADMLSEAISTRTGTPILPYSKGYAIGKTMTMKVADGDVYNLKLPEPDYTISVSYTGIKKVELQKTAAETAYAYGAYTKIKVEEPFSGKTYLDLNFKNGETKLVPATQLTVDDLPAYADAIRGLFNKLGENLSGRITAWLKTAASGTGDIEKQILQTTEIIKSCK